jgi:hypothetical protein
MRTYLLQLQNAAVLLIVLVFGFNACYPEMDRVISDSDVIITARNDETDFNTEYPNHTFAVPEQINIIRDTVDENNNVAIDSTLVARTSIDRVVQNMNDYGWRRVTVDQISNGETADVVIVISVNARSTYGAYISYPWWGWWGGWSGWPGYPGYPGWGPGWGGYYPPTVGYYSYSQGSILLDMLDPSDTDTNQNRIFIPWTAGINGLLRSSQTNSETVINQTIDRAFSQSPYLDVR